MPLDEKGLGADGDNVDAQGSSAKRGRQEQVTPDASLLEPLFGLGFEFLELHTPSATRTLRSGSQGRQGADPQALDDSRWIPA